MDGCNYSNTIDLHRIVNGKDGGEYTLDNICAICPNHHQEVHRLKFKIKFIDKFVLELIE